MKNHHRIWIDTDPALGLPLHDIDDAMALIAAFASPNLEISGISSVFGNANGDFTYECARELVKQYSPTSIPVYHGAMSKRDLGKPTDASDALQAALRREKLTVVSLGPATNIATVLQQSPELAEQIETLVVQTGRHVNHPASITLVGSITTGVFDFNFEKDVEAWRILLDSSVPIRLIPIESCQNFVYGTEELAALKKNGHLEPDLISAIEKRIAYYRRAFTKTGFIPYDLFAILSLVFPDQYTYQELPIEIIRDKDDIIPAKQKWYLRVSQDLASKRLVSYCNSIKPDLKQRGLDLLR